MFQLERATEALEYYNRALKIIEQTTLDADIDMSFATTLHDIGRCMLEMNRTTETLKYYFKVLKIKEQTTLIADIGTNLTASLLGLVDVYCK